VSGLLSRLFFPRPKATAEQARDLQRRGAVLLDVRQDAEWRAGHAPGAWHIPLNRLRGGPADLPPSHRGDDLPVGSPLGACGRAPGPGWP
jgi:rhodanese-related sulfurtransferase